MPGKSTIAQMRMKKVQKNMSHQSDKNTVDMSRRKALAKLGILTICAYAAPVLMTLSKAHGKDSSGSSGSSGSGSGGGSGSSGSSGAGSASGALAATGSTGATGTSGASGDQGQGSDGDRQSGRMDDDKFDFGDFNDLDPMSAEEEAGVVGHWD